MGHVRERRCVERFDDAGDGMNSSTSRLLSDTRDDLRLFAQLLESGQLTPEAAAVRMRNAATTINALVPPSYRQDEATNQ